MGTRSQALSQGVVSGSGPVIGTGKRDSQRRSDRGAPRPLPRSYKTIEQGAATSVWCATSPLLTNMGGVYCEDCDIARAVAADHVPLDGVLPWAIDPQLADRLWKFSEQCLAVTSPPAAAPPPAATPEPG